MQPQPEQHSGLSDEAAGMALQSQPVLEVNALKTYFFTRSGAVKAVDGVSFALARGETLAIVGGSQISLAVGLGSIVLGCLVGVPVGLLSGYFGGWLDLIVQRVIDIRGWGKTCLSINSTN